MKTFLTRLIAATCCVSMCSCTTIQPFTITSSTARDVFRYASKGDFVSITLTDGSIVDYLCVSEFNAEEITGTLWGSPQPLSFKFSRIKQVEKIQYGSLKQTLGFAAVYTVTFVALVIWMTHHAGVGH